jgi:hypothetical protein
MSTKEGITPWIEIARTGTFHDSQGRPHTFTEADLDAISAGYDPAGGEAPLVFGHPKDSDPAYGWVSALKVERGRALPGAGQGGAGGARPTSGHVGAKLFARFACVPEKVKKLVQDRRYRYVSMSLSPDKKRLLHVGLLGAAAPAIDGLAPVSLSGEGITINFAAPDREPDGGSMNPEEMQRQIGALNEQIKALQKENGDLKAKLTESAKVKDDAEKGKKDAEEKSAKTAAEFAAYKGKIAEDARAARVDALINAGKLEPAKKDETLSFAAALAQVPEPVNFTAPDGKAETISAEERWFRDLEARPVDARFNFTAPAPVPGHAAQLPADALPGDITSKL